MTVCYSHSNFTKALCRATDKDMLHLILVSRCCAFWGEGGNGGKGRGQMGKLAASISVWTKFLMLSLMDNSHWL